MALTRTGFILLIVVIVLLVIYVFPIHIHTRQQIVPPAGVSGGARSAHIGRPHASLSSFLWQASGDVHEGARARMYATAPRGGSLQDACACVQAAHVMKLAAGRVRTAAPVVDAVRVALVDEAAALDGYADAVFTALAAPNARVHCASHAAALPHSYLAFQKRVADNLHPVYSLVAALPRAALRSDINEFRKYAQRVNVAHHVDAIVAQYPSLMDTNIALSVYREAAGFEV